jgi:hypothetical protein
MGIDQHTNILWGDIDGGLTGVVGYCLPGVEGQFCCMDCQPTLHELTVPVFYVMQGSVSD